MLWSYLFLIGVCVRLSFKQYFISNCMFALRSVGSSKRTVIVILKNLRSRVHMTRLNSGITIRHIFFLWAIYFFHNSEILYHSREIRFWNIFSIFEIARVAFICVGNLLPKSPSMLILLYRSFSYSKFRKLI